MIDQFLCCSDNDITDVIDHSFCVDHEAYGEHKLHELKPGGKDIQVSEDNKKEYVKYVYLFLYVHWIVAVTLTEIDMFICFSIYGSL